jgi:hypothetical protein
MCGTDYRSHACYLEPGASRRIIGFRAGIQFIAVREIGQFIRQIARLAEGHIATHMDVISGNLFLTF